MKRAILLLILLAFFASCSSSRSRTIDVSEMHIAAGGTQLLEQYSPNELIWSCVFDPTGRLLLVARETTADLELYDVSTRKRILSFKGHKFRALTTTFSQDGSIIVSGGGQQREDCGVRWWDASTAEMLGYHRTEREITGVTISPDNRTIAMIDERLEVTLLDVASKRVTQVHPGLSQGISGSFMPIYFTRDGKYLCSPNGIWPVVESQPLLTVGERIKASAGLPAADSRSVFDAYASRTPADGSDWLLVHRYPRIFQYDIATGEVRRMWRLTCFGKDSVSVGPRFSLTADGKYIAMPSTYGPLLLKVDADDTAPILWRGKMPPPGNAQCVALSPDGKYLAVSNFGVYLWENVIEATEVGPVPAR